jgi:hypothetical protein
MDARKDRIGEHAAEHALSWAINALGPVSEDPVDRLDWQQRAACIGAWRELSGYDHPTDPIGPEPTAAAPDKRAAWYEALAALGPVDGPDVRGMPDGRLLHLRDTYPIETAWAPQWVGDELRQVRAGRPRSWPGRGRPGRLGSRHPRPAPSGRGRRRRTAPPASGAAVHPAPFGRITGRHRGPARRAHPDHRAGHPGCGPWIKDLAAGRRRFAARLADRQSLMIPAEDPDYGDLGQAFPAWTGSSREAILQPPKLQIRPSARVLERAADREADIEAGE